MELRHIDIENLAVSTANMRGKGRAPDLSNILPSIRARGILVPLIVRANGTPDSYEIVAGKRRYLSALTIVEEAGGIDPLPCAVIEPGDDAERLAQRVLGREHPLLLATLQWLVSGRIRLAGAANGSRVELDGQPLSAPLQLGAGNVLAEPGQPATPAPPHPDFS